MISDSSTQEEVKQLSKKLAEDPEFALQALRDLTEELNKQDEQE